MLSQAAHTTDNLAKIEASIDVTIVMRLLVVFDFCDLDLVIHTFFLRNLNDLRGYLIMNELNNGFGGIDE